MKKRLSLRNQRRRMKSNLVTSLKQLTTKRMLVYINYEPAFAVYTGEIKKFGIKEGDYIQDEIYQDIISTLSKRATVRAMNLLKTKDYTRAELAKKLYGSYYPEEAVSSAFEYIDRYGYLDDYRYAFNYIVSKSATKSRKQIVISLKDKGIDKQLIEQACDEIYASDDDNDIELDTIIKQLEKKLLKFNIDKLTYEDKQKLLSYFYRKGFSVDKARKALDIVVDAHYNN